MVQAHQEQELGMDKEYVLYEPEPTLAVKLVAVPVPVEIGRAHV